MLRLGVLFFSTDSLSLKSDWSQTWGNLWDLGTGVVSLPAGLGTLQVPVWSLKLPVQAQSDSDSIL